MSNPTFLGYAATSKASPLVPFEFDPGPLEPEEVEIQISYCGICHSDVSMLENDWGITSYPIIPGHEVIGTIVQLGDQTKGLHVGQKVGVGWSAYSCLSCFECQKGEAHLCSHNQGTIVGHHGGFANRMRAQWPWVRPIPDALDLSKAGPLLCGGITVFSPFLQHRILPTARVGVIGIGGLGHMALKFAEKWGCEVHAFTSSERKIEEAKSLGAHHVHSTHDAQTLKKLQGTFDLIVSTINMPFNVPGMLETLRPKGILHVVGAVLEPLAVPAMHLIGGQRSVSGSPTGSPTDLDLMLEFSARHGIVPVTEEFPLSQVNDALEHLKSGHAKYRIVLKNDLH